MSLIIINPNKHIDVIEKGETKTVSSEVIVG